MTQPCSVTEPGRITPAGQARATSTSAGLPACTAGPKSRRALRRYAAAALPYTQPAVWAPGATSGTVSLTVQNAGNISALFTLNSTGCCLTGPSGCTPGNVSIGPPQQGLVAPQAAQRFNFTVGMPPLNPSPKPYTLDPRPLTLDP